MKKLICILAVISMMILTLCSCVDESTHPSKFVGTWEAEWDYIDAFGAQHDHMVLTIKSNGEGTRKSQGMGIFDFMWEKDIGSEERIVCRQDGHPSGIVLEYIDNDTLLVVQGLAECKNLAIYLHRIK